MGLLNKANYDEDDRWFTNGVRIAWWDRSLKLWTSYIIDEKKNQRGETTYANNRDDFAVMEERGFFNDDKVELAKMLDLDIW